MQLINHFSGVLEAQPHVRHRLEGLGALEHRGLVAVLIEELLCL